MSQDRPNFFAGPYLDRRAELREDESWIVAAREDTTTRYLLGRGSTQLLHAGAEPGIAFLDAGARVVAEARTTDLVLLGWFRGTRVVLVDLPVGAAVELPPGSRFEGLRPLAPLLDGEHAGLLYARALATWRAPALHNGMPGTVCAAAIPPARRSSFRASTRRSSYW